VVFGIVVVGTAAVVYFYSIKRSIDAKVVQEKASAAADNSHLRTFLDTLLLASCRPWSNNFDALPMFTF
jgi:hypothetical protein